MRVELFLLGQRFEGGGTFQLDDRLAVREDVLTLVDGFHCLHLNSNNYPSNAQNPLRISANCRRDRTEIRKNCKLNANAILQTDASKNDEDDELTENTGQFVITDARKQKLTSVFAVFAVLYESKRDSNE